MKSIASRSGTSTTSTVRLRSRMTSTLTVLPASWSASARIASVVLSTRRPAIDVITSPVRSSFSVSLPLSRTSTPESVPK